MSLKKVGLLINYGPEIRPLILSGLIRELKESGNSVVIFSRFEIPLKDFPMIEGVPQERIPKVVKTKITTKLYGKFQIWLNKIWQARLRRLGYGNFHFSKGAYSEPSRADIFLGSEIIFLLADKTLTFFNSFRNDLSIFVKQLKEHAIEELIYTGSADLTIQKFLIGASRNQIKLKYILNNWKDVYMYHYFPVIPEKVFYWSDFLYKDAIVMNPRLAKTQLFVSGNPTFYRFLDYNPQITRKELLQRYGHEDNDIVLWPTAQSSMLPNEHLLIEKVANELKKNSSGAPLLMLRMNPFGISKEKEAFFENIPNVIICKNYWEVDRKKDITYQTEEGETEWKDLLFHSNWIVSVPSTIALEAPFFRKKVINFVFNEKDQYENNTGSFLSTTFYKPLVENEHIIVVQNFKELLAILSEKKNTLTEHSSKLPGIISGNDSYSAKYLSEVILD